MFNWSDPAFEFRKAGIFVLRYHLSRVALIRFCNARIAGEKQYPSKTGPLK